MTPETFSIYITSALFIGKLVGMASTFYFVVRPLKGGVMALQSIIRRTR